MEAVTNIALLCRDRFRLTEQCLASLYANTPHKEFNLTVVNDGSQDFRIRRLLSRYAEEYSNFTVLEVEQGGHVLAQLKNLAIFWSRQRFGAEGWLYVGDSDTYFLPGWMEKLTTAADCTEQNGFRLWGGQIHPFHQPINQVDALPVLVPNGTVASPVTVTQHSVLDGPSWLMRWSTWREIGPFSRKCAPGTGRSEDVEWCGRLVDRGYRIGVIRPHCVIHVGLTNTDGQPIPGAEELAAMVPQGVVAE